MKYILSFILILCMIEGLEGNHGVLGMSKLSCLPYQEIHLRGTSLCLKKATTRKTNPTFLHYRISTLKNKMFSACFPVIFHISVSKLYTKNMISFCKSMEGMLDWQWEYLVSLFHSF